jgi:hypothetical protein
MSDRQLTFEEKVEAAAREAQRQVERREKAEPSPACERCQEARRFADADSDEVRRILAGWVGRTLTEEGLDEIVGIVDEANEAATLAWLIVEEMDEAADNNETEEK